eukprot:4973592-Pyramimonas_sp.AAC.1
MLTRAARARKTSIKSGKPGGHTSPEAPTQAHRLDAIPTDIELNKCVSKMKTGRQPGDGGFVAEALKH